MDDDRKAINERRADRIAHVAGCGVCRVWMAIDLEEAMMYPRPQATAYLEAHGDHLREVGFVGLGNEPVPEDSGWQCQFESP